MIYILGVGPGDPELLTIKAARVLALCHTILHAGTNDRAGFAVEVIADHILSSHIVKGMNLAMKRGADDGSVGYDRVALALIAEETLGRTAVFLTEGDPMLFGSGSYVAERLQSLAPKQSVEIVPGISSISAAAAKLGWHLAQKHAIFTVCPATYHSDDIGAILDRDGASCWLKAADVLPRLIEELSKRGRLEKAALVERLGKPDERIFRDLREAVRQDLSYFSLVLVRS